MTMKTSEEIVGHIAAEIDAAKMPEELRERLVAFYDQHSKEASGLRIGVLLCAMEWIQELTAKTSDQDLMDRIASIELTFAAAIIFRRMKKRLGEPISPARFALVAYDIAEQAAEISDPEPVLDKLYQDVTAA
jgi:hypothetical protein